MVWAAGDVGGQQMRRLVQGCYGGRELAERMSQVELVGGRQGHQAGHPHHRVRLVYRLLDRLLNSQPGMASPRRAPDVADEARHQGAAGSSAQEVAQRLDGALGFLQDAYWDWLRLEWLPAIQVALAHPLRMLLPSQPRPSSPLALECCLAGQVTWQSETWQASSAGQGASMPLIRNETLALDVVRAWVTWFLGSQPLHAQWEVCARPSCSLPPRKNGLLTSGNSVHSTRKRPVGHARRCGHKSSSSFAQVPSVPSCCLPLPASTCPLAYSNGALPCMATDWDCM